MHIDPAAARLLKVLSHMAQASQAALVAGSAGDEEATRSATDQLRRLQSKLNNIDSSVRNTLNGLPPEYQASVQLDVSNIRKAEPFVQKWCQRYRDLVSPEILSQSEDGRQGLLDYSLPLDWNFDADLFVLFGDDEVILADALKKRGQNRILALAVNDSFHSPVDLVCPHDEVQIRDFFSNIRPPLPMRVAMLNVQHKKTYQKQWDIANQALTLCMSNSHTSELYGKSWLTQGLVNLPHIARGMNMAALKQALQGMPIIIVSPGPSLDKNIHWLQEAKGRAVIIAAAQCARALAAAAIVPDFIAVADPNNLVYFLDGVDVTQVKGLITGVSCHPGFYAKPFPHIFTFNANATIDAWISDIFGDTLPISAAGSVSIDCLYIAKFVRASHIIMVGLDLALSNGQTYSTTSANATSKVLLDPKTKTLSFTNVPQEMEQVFLAKGASSEDTVEPALTLPGYYGGEVITRPNYHLFHGELVEIARLEQALDSPTPLVNCTEGGAYIPGFEHIALKEAIDKYLPRSILDIDNGINNAKKSMDYAARTSQLAEATKKMTEKIQNVLKLVEQCTALSKPGKSKDIKKLNKAERKLINEVRTMPYLSIPNGKQTKIALEMSADATDLDETNGVANFIYQTIHNTGSEILSKLRTHEARY